MPTILERIEADITAARRSADHAERDSLVFLLNEVRRPGKDHGNRPSTDLEAIGVIRKLIGSNDETVRALAGSSRASEIAAVEEGTARMQRYLPTQMTEDELRSMIRKFCTGQNWTDEKPSMKWMGEIMSMLRECQLGRYDPAAASRVAREILTELTQH